MLDGVFANLARLRLLKVDVEGMELDVLEGSRELILRTRPILYVENDRPARSEALVASLRALSYDLYWHTPRLFNPANYFGNRENVFGGTLSTNILGVPLESGIRVEGFPRVESPIYGHAARPASGTRES
jgi:hypothetical protein